MTMLEQVATAIEEDLGHVFDRGDNLLRREDFLSAARAAIAAMAIPNESMIKPVAQAIAGEMAQSADLWGKFEHVARPAIAALFAALREEQA